jgi:hypothetical protein
MTHNPQHHQEHCRPGAGESIQALTTRIPNMKTHRPRAPGKLWTRANFSGADELRSAMANYNHLVYDK